MKMRLFYRHALALALASIILGAAVYAQPVDIPDSKLRAAIEDTLNIPPDAVITQEDMQRLVELGAYDRGIIDLTGLEHATRLRGLYLTANEIADLRPLAHLTALDYLNLSSNRIVDIGPLANLAHLTELHLYDNLIVDFAPLRNLSRLNWLDVRRNETIDHSPIDGMSIDTFLYDQVCDMPPLPLEPRLANRSFPSVFSAWGGIGWSPIRNQPHKTDWEQMSQHDLYFCCLIFNQEFFDTGNGWEIKGSLEHAIQLRDKFHALNPNMVFLVGVSLVWEAFDTFPADSPYWRRNEHGEIIPAFDSGLVDLRHPYIQQRALDKVRAVSKCGLYDGVFFDGWAEYGRQPGDIEAMIDILKGIRDNVRSDFLIMVNPNVNKIPRFAPYVNGIYMESQTPYGNMVDGGIDAVSAAFRDIEDTLKWAEANLLPPQINGLAGWGFPDETTDNAVNVPWARTLTALTLTLSDGYIFYVHPFKGKYKRYWYEFWDADLGRPVGEKGQLYQETEGLYIREFTNGWAVYNHSGSEQTIRLPELASGVASRLEGAVHTLPDLDGEMYLRVKPANPADVNRDGVVNLFDLTIVAQAIGTDGAGGDVNGDGVVNVFDLVVVANAF